MTEPARKNKATPAASDGFSRAAIELLHGFSVQRPIRAGSLLITVFGDAIAPHGGTVWLGALIRVLEGFGINQRLVRTSVFRLVKEGWLEADQIGRRSYYRLSAEGRSRFRNASRRIYSEPRQEWSGGWTMVLLSAVDAARRDGVRKSLRWLGFAPFSANLMSHPAPDAASLEQLDALPDRDRLLIMESLISDDQQDTLRALVDSAWRLDELGERYAAFVNRFRAVYQAARGRRRLDPERAFQVRTLLVHEYRKIVLRDPLLPAALLPARWAGVPAYQLCRNLYSIVAGSTERFLTERMETAEGPLPPAEPQYFQRFGGLAESEFKRTTP